MTMLLRNLVLVLLSLTLVSCNNEKTRNLIDKRADETQQGLLEARAPAPPKSYNPLVVSDKVWAGQSSLRMRRGLPLPEKYEATRGVTLVAADPLSLTELANLVSNQTAIPVRVAPGTTSTGGSGSSASGSASASSGASASNAAGGMSIAYEGPLSGLLDQVAAFYGINWRYDGTSINFSRFETRVFMIESLPGTQTVKDGIKEDSSSGGSGGSSSGGSSGGTTNALQQSSEMNVEFKVWDEIGQTVTAILNGVGNAVVAPSSGTITVTTTPETMRTVAKFIEEENKRLSRQIAINIEIYTVNLSEGTNFSSAFNTALGQLVKGTGKITGAAAPTTVAGDTITGANFSLAILNARNGSIATDMFTALSTLGDTSRLAQFPLTTLNNRPVSRRVGNDKAYVASTSNTISGSSSLNSNAITTGVIREGFSIQITPRLLDDGRIMLQYSFSLIDIVKIVNFGSTGNQVQLPETSNRVFVQQSLLKSGSTLIMGGYDDEQAQQNAQGVGSPFNFLLGGGSSNATSHAMLFIAITPQVLDIPRTVEQQ